MKLSARVVTPLVHFILARICRLDEAELAKVPRKGPLIIVANHINFLEVPLLYASLHPRGIVGLVKAETWDNAFLGFLGKVWEAIPLDRSSTDTKAMKLALAALAAGKILIVAPEGTRSGNGRLQRGHGGVVQLAARSGAPILPIAHFGGERFWANIKKPRRTRLTFRVGELLHLNLPESGFSKSSRAEATDEIMRSIAQLLPAKYHGVYAIGVEAPGRHLSGLSSF